MSWLRGCFSERARALEFYRKGMAKAKNHDHQGALVDYSAAIESPDAPADLKAMAIYNRALVYTAIGDDAKAIEDLQAVLVMPGAQGNVLLEVKRKLIRMQMRAEQNETPKQSKNSRE